MVQKLSARSHTNGDFGHSLKFKMSYYRLVSLRRRTIGRELAKMARGMVCGLSMQGARRVRGG